jgi:hypothetical protein
MECISNVSEIIVNFIISDRCGESGTTVGYIYNLLYYIIYL